MSNSNEGLIKEQCKIMAAEFDPDEVKFKPQAIKGDRALALAYVDVRVIQDRLDDAVGVQGWQDEYQLLPDNSVMCKLRVFLGLDNEGIWITKMDVGSPSEQPDGGDRMKAAFSDALKRAAVKFGIGRYLYRLKAQWCRWDVNKKQFIDQPKIVSSVATPDPKIVKVSTTMYPRTWDELQRRLNAKDASLVGVAEEYIRKQLGYAGPLEDCPEGQICAVTEFIIRSMSEKRN